MKKSAFWLVVIVIGTLTLVSCDPKENVNSMVEKVWTFSHSRESLTFVVEHALNHDGYVGGWLDSESGLYYFDSTKIFPEDQLEEALEFARENGQNRITSHY